MDINSQEHIKALGPDVAKAYKLSKELKYEEAYNVLLPHFNAKEIPTFYEETCGWIIYKYVKNNDGKLSSHDIKQIYLNSATL